MTIEELVRFAESQALNATVVEQACIKEKLSLQELYTAFARDVAEKYAKGVYSWSYCDAAMNRLFAYAYPVTDTGLPEFAWKVYIAFDEGEYFHPGDPKDFDPESRTKALLAEISERNSR
ncbi:MAG: hypothetical protein ABSH21_13110 [Verrucomicrobiia bacterium]|jgi:hypothetical protein